MIQKVLRVCLSLVLFGSAFAFAAPAVAGPVATGAESGISSQVFSSAGDGMKFAGSSSSPTTSPSGPADSGTGETKESKETRVDYAPYVIGAIVVVVLVAAFFFWRKRRVSHPAKPD
jgi:hypothetical protein